MADTNHERPASQLTATTATSRGKRFRRRLLWSAGILAVVIAGTGIAAVVAVQTESGSRLVWNAAKKLLPGQLGGELVAGTLRNGLSLRNVEYRSAGQIIKVDKVQGAWNVFRAPLTLDINFLRLGTVDVTLLPTPSTPLVMPAEIKLPLAINLESATIEKIVIHQDTTTTQYSDVRLQINSDGTRHGLDLANVTTPFGKIAASLRLHGVQPFALSGSAELEGSRGDQQYRLAAQLSGSLALLGIKLDGSDDKLNGTAVINAMPFGAVPLRDATVLVRHLNPQTFNPEWPRADLDIRATLKPVGKPVADLTQMTVFGPVSIVNASPGPIDKALVPLLSMAANVTLDAKRQQLSALKIVLPSSATLEGNGELQGDTGRLMVAAKRLNLQALHTAMQPTALDGPLTARLAGNNQYLELDLADEKISAKAEVEIGLKQITLQSARLRAAAGELTAAATLARDEKAAYKITGKLSNFNPALFVAMMPAGDSKTAKAGKVSKASTPASKPTFAARINTSFDARGFLRPELTADVGFKVYDSIYDNLPMTGGGTLRIAGTKLLPSDLQLLVAGNTLRLQGSFGNPADKLNVDLNAPALDRLGFGLSGLAVVKGTLGGTLTRPVVDATYRAQRLRFGDHQADAISGRAQTQGVPGQTPDARVAISIDAKNIRSGDIALTSLNGNLDGTYARHTLQVKSSGRLRGKPLDVRVAAQGALAEKSGGLGWNGTLQTFENAGLPRIRLARPLSVDVAPGRVELGSTRLNVARAVIDLKNFRFADNVLRSEGSLSGLDIGELLALRQQFTGEAPPVVTDLVIDGDWNVSLANTASGVIRLDRRRGDVRAGETALGLSAMSLRADLQGTGIKFDARVVGTRVGTIGATGGIGMQRIDGALTLTPQSPINALVTAALPRLQSLGVLAGPGIALSGSAGADVAIAGMLADPKLSGTISGDGLALTLYDQGVRLKDGIARIGIDNNVLVLRQMQFRGGDGTLTASGRIALDRTNPGLSATVVADRLQLLASPAGQLTVSGQVKAANVDARLLVSGKFTVDNAVFSLPEKTAPELDGDVVVVRGGKAPPIAQAQPDGPSAKPSASFTPDVDVELDLGNRFYFKGSGADLRLAGALKVRSAPRTAPQAFGTIRVAEGTYEAFGTKLAIERGIINFQGPLRNPNINLLAMRRQPEVSAGVQVTGDAQRPRVELVSEPSLSQEEKLSWLVFGHGSSSGSGAGGAAQAQNAVKGAAFGLLNSFGGKNVAKSLGLDALAIGSSEYGLSGGQVVNLGKKISDKITIGYEQSLASAGSVLKLTYTLTQYWSLVVRGGTVTGMDVFYNKRFDSIKDVATAAVTTNK
ncbi:MAG: translocation/assembly module TamB domain-containing protein [Pseudomonadota bacterium]